MPETSTGSLLHPRPQLQRAQWVSLDGPWRFAFDPEQRWHATRGHRSSGRSTINVPFAPESRLSGIGDTGFHPVCWYQREFSVPATSDLHDGAVACAAAFRRGRLPVARVWVNGLTGGRARRRSHAVHRSTSPAHCRPGDVQGVTVQAIDDPHDLEKPRGKQDWQLEPHAIWYPRTTGIWQTVWLERVPRTYVDAMRWTPNLERWEIALRSAHRGRPRRRDLSIEVRLHRGERLLIDDDATASCTARSHRKLGLSDPGIDDFRNELLWCPERPTLLQADDRTAARRQGHRPSCSRTRRCALQRPARPLHAQRPALPAAAGARPGLLARHLLTAPDDAALRRDVELAKAMGFNGVRKHQKIEDPRYLYWADVLGLLVWEEMPSAYRFTPRCDQPHGARMDRGDRRATAAIPASSSGCRSTNRGACPT